MWVRAAAIRPVPKYALVRRRVLELVGKRVDKANAQGQGTTFVSNFDRAQPILAKQLHRLLERPLDETARALGIYLGTSLWMAFEESFGGRLERVSVEVWKATEESIRVEEELRREHAEEPLDLEDVVMLEQPEIVEWVHELVDAATDVSEDDSDNNGEVDVDDLHLVYRTALTLALALSYGVKPPEGELVREIMA
jgi:hypothetical protein